LFLAFSFVFNPRDLYYLGYTKKIVIRIRIITIITIIITSTMFMVLSS